MLSRLVSNSNYVLEGKDCPLCRWQFKLRPHLGINDTHVRKALNNTRPQSTRLYDNHPYRSAHIPSSRLVNLPNEELCKKAYHLKGLLVKKTILKYLLTTYHQHIKQRTCCGM